MKKFIYASLAIASLLLFASCNKDKNQPKSGEMADAFISFTFNLPQKGFRAEAGSVDEAHAQDTYVGTADEQEIKAVRVVLFDPTSGEVKYSLDYSITSTGTANPTGEVTEGATIAKFTTKAKQVVNQEYQMLAIINPTTTVKNATAEGKYLADAKGAITTTANELKGTGFMMSNDRGLVTVHTSNLKADASSAEDAPVAVSVDRILAKVFVGGNPTIKTGATFTDIKWGLNTTNKKTFIYRQFGKVVNSSNNFTDETAGDSSTRFNRYAKDPNFLASEFTTSDFSYVVGTPTLTKTFGFDDADGEYCLENTMDASEQKVNRTTSFILSGTWKPADHNGITFTEGETWYSYMGFTFTKAKMLEYKGIVEDQTQNAKLEINGTPAGFKAALKAALEGGMNIDGAGDITQSGTFNGITAYKAGVCYYQKNLIRHWDNTQSSKDMGYGRYGVVRNNIYKITISKISQPGEPTVVTEDDEDDDPTKVWVAFDITVNPWLVREQSIEL